VRRFFALTAIATLCACSEKAPPPPPAKAAVAAPNPALLTPDSAKLAATGPDSFTVHFITSRGPFDVTVHRAWAPRGADRLYYLVNNGFYDGLRFYRVLDGFMAQFGAPGNPALTPVWNSLMIPDDPVTRSNKRGTLTFATRGPNTRTTHLFINYGNNAQLDKMGFTVIGEVANGMPVVDSLYKGYGEGAPSGQGPDQGRIGNEGNAYLAREFPKLDSIVTAKVATHWP
jgi:peptidyl-prolyl cis-trans isomerase A (cyclophilin A)